MKNSLFAALDTFENEPKPEIKLLMHPKISLTPHIGAATLEAQDRIGEELADQIIRILNPKAMLESLKKRWGIDSNFQLFVIFIVFGTTGSMSVKLGLPVLEYFDVTKDRFGSGVYLILRILLIFPLYQVLLLFFELFFSIQIFLEI